MILLVPRIGDCFEKRDQEIEVIFLRFAFDSRFNLTNGIERQKHFSTQAKCGLYFYAR